MKINLKEIIAGKDKFHQEKPFPHLIVDDFIEEKFARGLSSEFPNINDQSLFKYDNPLEKKFALNDWNRFPKNTYAFLKFLCSDEVVEIFSDLVGIKLYADPGLHGGGWHLHENGGKLNPHLDYNIHPKLGLQRKLNLIIYLPDVWEETWGGQFGLWSNDHLTSAPKKLEKEINVNFNRAVIFDTTYQSWHGLSKVISTPNGEIRKSLAIYYLCDPPADSDSRERALYAPSEDQIGNADVAALIKKRADNNDYKTSYIVKEVESAKI